MNQMIFNSFIKMYYLTNKYCCTCLNTESTKLIDLTNLDSDTITYYEKLAICVPNRISLEMKIQENFLCEDCCRNITQFYDFYNVCMKSKTILDNIGLKVQYFKVGDQNTVVNIIPNDYYLFNNGNDDVNVAKNDEIINEIKTNDDVSHTEKGVNKNNIDPIETDVLCPFIKKRKTHKTTTELVNSILKEKIIQDSSYTCNICQKKFNKKGLLIVHITLEHSNKKIYCQTCDKHCDDNDDYKAHMESHKPNKKEQKKQYTCNYCERIFTSNSALCRHKKIHTNDRRYACDICSVRYIQKAQIINHITKYHPGYVYEEKKCKQCRKVFETKNDLEIHNKINHELKFDLKTLEILQTSTGNIRNIIECVNNTENTGDINYSNSADDKEENFITNCDLIQYNTDMIENIGSVNMIDLDIIQNAGIIEEHIQEINERFTDDVNEMIQKDLNENCDMKEIEDNNDISAVLEDDIDKNGNIESNTDNNIDVDENMDNNVDINENMENIIDITGNMDSHIDISVNRGINIDINEDMENNFDKNENINNHIDVKKNIENIIDISGDIENDFDINTENNIDINENMDNTNQNLIFSYSHENIESSNGNILKNDPFDIPVAINDSNLSRMNKIKTSFKDKKMYNKKFLYNFNRFDKIKKSCRKRRDSKQNLCIKRTLKFRTIC